MRANLERFELHIIAIIHRRRINPRRTPGRTAGNIVVWQCYRKDFGLDAVDILHGFVIDGDGSDGHPVNECGDKGAHLWDRHTEVPLPTRIWRVKKRLVDHGEKQLYTFGDRTGACGCTATIA